MQLFGREKSHTDGDNAAVFGKPNETQVEEKKEEEKVQDEQTQDEGQSVEQEQKPQNEEKPGDSETEENTDEEISDKSDKLADRFENRSSLIDGIANLGKELGKEIDPTKVQQTDTKELEEVYQELLSEMGRTSDVKKTRKENQELKEEVNQYQNEISQMKTQLSKITNYLQQVEMNKNQRNAQPQQQNMQVQQPGQSQMSGQPSRDPNTGKFVKRNQQDNQPQTQQRESDVDPDEWLREFYKNPVQAVQKISNMNQQQQQEIKQNMNQEQKQDFREQQNKVQEQKRRAYRQNLQQKQQQHFTAKKRELEQKYGDDFSNPETKKAILDYVREHPIYLNPNIFPDGIDIAYREAKKEINNNNSNNKPVPENNEEIINQKKAAGLPKSQGSKVMTNQNDNSNEELINRLFKKKGGLFNK